MCQCGRGKPGPGAFCRNRAGLTASELTVHAGELLPRLGSARPHRGRERKRKPHRLLLAPRRLWPKHGPLLEGQQVPPQALSTRTPACFPSAITPGFRPVKAPRLRHGLLHLPQEATGLRGGNRPWQVLISLETRRRAGAGPRAACHPGARSQQVPLRHPCWWRLPPCSEGTRSPREREMGRRKSWPRRKPCLLSKHRRFSTSILTVTRQRHYCSGALGGDCTNVCFSSPWDRRLQPAPLSFSSCPSPTHVPLFSGPSCGSGAPSTGHRTGLHSPCSWNMRCSFRPNRRPPFSV